MLQLQLQGNTVTVFWNGSSYGTVELYENPYHTQNQYLRCNLTSMNDAFSAELFEKLYQLKNRPLQVMVDSENKELCAFLTDGGFQCRRKCFEVEASAEDYIDPQVRTVLHRSQKGEVDYARCCELLYGYYCETHKAINPWTAGLETFGEELPEDVFYVLKIGEISALAFVEKNEIAYVAASSETEFDGFAASLIANMLEKYDTVCFESDDCDWVAMRLRAMFRNQSETSFDTYVYSTPG